MQLHAGWLMAAVASALSACAPGGASPRDDVAGRWHACVTTLSGTGKSPACGSLTVTSDTTKRPARVPDYWLEHTIHLETVLTDPPRRLPAFGTLRHGPDSTWTFELGTPRGASESVDAGSLYGVLRWRGRTLVGHWRRDCYAACRDSGTIELRR
jgi:hypothetical protein